MEASFLIVSRATLFIFLYPCAWRNWTRKLGQSSCGNMAQNRVDGFKGHFFICFWSAVIKCAPSIIIVARHLPSNTGRGILSRNFEIFVVKARIVLMMGWNYEIFILPFVSSDWNTDEPIQLFLDQASLLHVAILRLVFSNSIAEPM